MHCEERGTVKFLECRHKDNLKVLHRKHVKVSEIKLCSAAVNEQLAVYSFKESGTIRCFYLWKLRKLLSFWWLSPILVALRSLWGWELTPCQHIWVHLCFFFLSRSLGCHMYIRGHELDIRVVTVSLVWRFEELRKLGEFVFSLLTLFGFWGQFSSLFD